jgi:hypothetical protein
MTADILDGSLFEDFDAQGDVDISLANPASHTFYYHITNQTAAGGSAEFPVTTAVVLKDLRIVQWYADGSCREVPLFDGDGMRTTKLAPAMVFLESIDNPPPHPLLLEAVCVAGRIEPSVLEIQSTPSDAVHVVRVKNEFLIDVVDPHSGAYFVISVSDRQGNRYPVGTFGILASE